MRLHALREYENRPAMMQSLAFEIADALRSCIADKGVAVLAVPGGTTPRPFFEALSRMELPWENVTIMLTDERLVAESSPRSNTALVRGSLCHNYAAAAQLFSLVEITDDAITLSTKDTPQPDILILGMGADMHIASLFPGAEGLKAALAPDAPALVAVKSTEGEERVSLSAGRLRAAPMAHLLIAGKEKKAALMRAAKINDPRQAPVCLILSHAKLHYAP